MNKAEVQTSLSPTQAQHKNAGGVQQLKVTRNKPRFAHPVQIREKLTLTGHFGPNAQFARRRKRANL
jgi:hypothetical protein